MTHDDYLAHHKYVSRVGGPGHWKYIYTTQSNGVELTEQDLMSLAVQHTILLL